MWKYHWHCWLTARRCIVIGLHLKSQISSHQPSRNKSTDGNHSLSWRVSHRTNPVKKYLNDDTADVNSKDCNEWTALHDACHHGHLDIVELLLNQGADTEVRTMDDETPLVLACRQGHLSVIKLLLDRWPLGNKECVTELLAHGEELHSENNLGNTPLHVACRSSSEQCVIVWSRF